MYLDGWILYLSYTYFLFLPLMKNHCPDSWENRLKSAHLRQLNDYSDKIDFASNDYLGFAKEYKVKKIVQLNFNSLQWRGSSGSRLISGNQKWIEDIEMKIACFHHAETSLIFPSAYQANVGLFSAIAGRNDLYLTDENVHASIIDGIRLSFAQHFKFKHHDFIHLNNLIKKFYPEYDTIFVVTESLFSMDGDSPPMDDLLKCIDQKKVFLMVDEAHGFGIMGYDNLGLFNAPEYAKRCLARVIGYGKSLGFSGAAIIGSEMLKRYLVNFSRSYIFSTALPCYHYQIIYLLYDELINHSHNQLICLKNNITYFLE